jgi:2,3-bisphosphoglycerate-independent phosphoglycerate mutase
MVGHTDRCSNTSLWGGWQMCRKVITAALSNDYTTIVIADHGNCETMINWRKP